MTEPSIVDRLASALTELHTAIDARPDDALTTLSQCVLTVLPQADHAGIGRATGEGLELVTASGPVAEQFAAMQTELARGPSVDAAMAEAMAVSADLHRDDRWCEFGPRVAKETGMRSAVAVRLPGERDESPFVLTVLSGLVAAFTDEAMLAILALATCGGLALAGARRGARLGNLERALETNRDIGTAIGVLMALHRTTREEAFELLRGASQKTHRKVSEIARAVAETGSLHTL